MPHVGMSQSPLESDMERHPHARLIVSLDAGPQHSRPNLGVGRCKDPLLAQQRS